MKAVRDKAILTDGPIGIQLARLATPMVVGIVAMMAFNVVDTFFVGRLGTAHLAAMAMTFPLVMVVTSLALGISVSTSIAVSQAIGRGDTQRVRRLTTDALLLGALLTVAFTIFCSMTLDRALIALGCTPETQMHAAAYMRAWLTGLVFVIIPMIANMAIRATGDTLTPSVLLILGVAINVVLDPILIFGVGPFPRMGITGAAWATVISRAITFVVSLWILVVRERMLATVAVPPMQIIRSWIKLLRNGIPIAINNLVTPLTAGAITRLTASVSTAAVAAFGVVTRVEGLTLTAVYALQAVVGIFIGQNVGANRWDRVRGAMSRTEGFGLAWGGVIFVLLLALGRPLCAMFDPNPEVVDAAYWYIIVAGLSLGHRCVYLLASAGLNSLDHATAATVLTLIQGVGIAIPAAWFGGRVWGLPGIFTGIALANIITGVATSMWLTRAIRNRERRSLEEAG